MADITNPQAVQFCNEQARVFADFIGQMNRTYSQFMLDVVAKFEAHAGGNANGDAIVDGSATDGRGPITKGDILALKYVVEQLQACMNTDDRIALVNKVAVNTRPIF